jgi:exodeoxyribonuclease VII large subunit
MRRSLEEKLRYFDLSPRLRRDRERMNLAAGRVEGLVRAALNRRRQRFAMLDAKLTQLNPRLVLSRGYAIVLSENGQIVRDAAAAPAGSDVKLMFARDAVRARITASPVTD